MEPNICCFDGVLGEMGRYWSFISPKRKTVYEVSVVFMGDYLMTWREIVFCKK